MAIFGTNYPRLVISGSVDLDLEESKIDYSFFGADVIEYKSVLNGFRSFAYAQNQSSFKVDVNLCNYSSSQANDKFATLYNNINSYWYFYPHEEYVSASSDDAGEPIEYFITEFTPYYLNNDVDYDAISITLEPRSNSTLYATDIFLGYGYTYGYNWGTGF